MKKNLAILWLVLTSSSDAAEPTRLSIVAHDRWIAAVAFSSDGKATSQTEVVP